jgi:hypothetical protein
MTPHMENPALAARGAPKSDQADGSIVSEYTSSLLILQASNIARRVGVDPGMAVTLAPMIFGVL